MEPAAPPQLTVTEGLSTLPIRFSHRPKSESIVITATGHIDSEEIQWMRNETLRLLGESGIQNFIVNLRQLRSIAQGDDLETFRLGDDFQSVDFPLDTRTAVVPPRDPMARRQAEFLHRVEKNRGRAALRYVADEHEADAWFST